MAPVQGLREEPVTCARVGGSDAHGVCRCVHRLGEQDTGPENDLFSRGGSGGLKRAQCVTAVGGGPGFKDDGHELAVFTHGWAVWKETALLVPWFRWTVP